jgi:hypothetical protein
MFVGIFIFGALAVVVVVAFLKMRSQRGQFDD